MWSETSDPIRFKHYLPNYSPKTLNSLHLTTICIASLRFIKSSVKLRLTSYRILTVSKDKIQGFQESY